MMDASKEAYHMFGNLFGGAKRKPDSWRDGPATPSQKSWAIELGIPFSSDITKGDLSDLIDRKEQANKKRTGGIITQLKKEVAQLKKEVGGLKKTAKKVVKKSVKRKK
jgi:hypothetical protein